MFGKSSEFHCSSLIYVQSLSRPGKHGCHCLLSLVPVDTEATCSALAMKGVALQLGSSNASPVRVRVPQAQPICCALSTLTPVMMLPLLQMDKASDTLSSRINNNVLCCWRGGRGGGEEAGSGWEGGLSVKDTCSMCCQQPLIGCIWRVPTHIARQCPLHDHWSQTSTQRKEQTFWTRLERRSTWGDPPT